MDLPVKTQIVVTIPVHLFQMTDSCGTLLSLRIKISVATKILKSEIQYFLLSIFQVQNKGSTQAKQILTHILTLTKLLKASSMTKFWRLLMIK